MTLGLSLLVLILLEVALLALRKRPDPRHEFMLDMYNHWLGEGAAQRKSNMTEGTPPSDQSCRIG